MLKRGIKDKVLLECVSKIESILNSDSETNDTDEEEDKSLYKHVSFKEESKEAFSNLVPIGFLEKIIDHPVEDKRHYSNLEIV